MSYRIATGLDIDIDNIAPTGQDFEDFNDAARCAAMLSIDATMDDYPLTWIVVLDNRDERVIIIDRRGIV